MSGRVQGRYQTYLFSRKSGSGTMSTLLSSNLHRDNDNNIDNDGNSGNHLDASVVYDLPVAIELANLPPSAVIATSPQKILKAIVCKR